MPVERLVEVDQLIDGVPVRVEVSGQALLVVMLDNRIHVMSDVCPHNGASLSEGLVRDGCVTCPSHLWRFDLHTGERRGRPDVRLTVHGASTTADGWVEVDVPAAQPVLSLREALLAHARTQTDV